MARHHPKAGKSHKSRGFKHKGGGPAVAGHIMTPTQERADRMANRAAMQGGDSPFAGGQPMAGPAPSAIGGQQPSPPGQQPGGMPGGDADESDFT